MPVVRLSDIRLSAEDLPEAHLSSSQKIYSPTAPSPPVASLGWRDRWWLQGQPRQAIAIHYWLFEQPEEAYEAADAGRVRLSARQVMVDGELQSIYQKLEAPACGEVCWQAVNNILFVRENVVILVAESGHIVTLGEMFRIANMIDQRISS